LVLGMTATTLVYRISALINFHPVYLLWLTVMLGCFVFRLIKHPPHKKNFEFSLTRSGIVFLVIILLVVFVLIIDNYRNGIAQPDGSVVTNWHYYDGFTKNNLIRELSHSVPPQIPFAAGIPLSYHHSMELFIAMLYKHFHLGVLDLLHRFTMTFFFALLLMTLFIFIRQITRSNKATLLGVFLIIFGTGGFGYIGGILSIYTAYWGKIFYSFYFLDLLSINSFLPAFSILFAGFFCLSKYFEHRKISWLIMAGYFLAVVFDYKMSIPLLILGALAFTGLVYFLRYREKSAIYALILTGLMLVPLFLLAYFHNIGGTQFVPKLRFNNWIIFTLVDLKLMFLARPWGELTRHSHVTFVNIALFLPILVGFFLGSFGFSFISLPGVFREFISSRKKNIMRFFLVSFFIFGILIFFCYSLVLGGRPKPWTNIYVFYFSVIILTIFWAEKVIHFSERKKRATKVIILCLIILLSIPNTIHFLWAKLHYPQKKVFEKPFLNACQWLNENTEGESVILHSKNMLHVCYFADRRAVLDISGHSNLVRHLTTSQIEERMADINRFFFNPIINADVLTKYRVSYVWVITGHDFTKFPLSGNNRIDCFSRIGGRKIKKYYKTHSLSLAYTNDNYSIFEVQARKYKEDEVYVLKKEGDVIKLEKFSDIYGKQNPES